MSAAIILMARSSVSKRYRCALLFCVLLFTVAVQTLVAQSLRYPSTPPGQVVDDYHGARVPDPYRWLENLDSEETATNDDLVHQSQSFKFAGRLQAAQGCDRPALLRVYPTGGHSILFDLETQADILAFAAYHTGLKTRRKH